MGQALSAKGVLWTEGQPNLPHFLTQDVSLFERRNRFFKSAVSGRSCENALYHGARFLDVRECKSRHRKPVGRWIRVSTQKDEEEES